MSNTYTPKTAIAIPPVEVTFVDDVTGDNLAIVVQTTIKDRSAYEIHAHKNGWPTERPMQTATFLWSGFLAWSALRREADAPAQLKTRTPDEFFDAILDVIPVSEEEGEETLVTPTEAAAGHEHV